MVKLKVDDLGQEMPRTRPKGRLPFDLSLDRLVQYIGIDDKL